MWGIQGKQLLLSSSTIKYFHSMKKNQSFVNVQNLHLQEMVFSLSVQYRRVPAH
jgi:hypothetical protein